MTEQLAPPIAPSFELSSLEPIETFALQHGMPERVLELPQGFVATGEVVAEKGQHERSMLQLASIIERGEDGDTRAYILAADSIDDRGVPNRVVVLPYNADTETRGNRVRVSDVIRYNLAKGRSNTIKFGDEDDRIGQLSLQIDEGGPAKFIWKSLVAGKKPTVEIGIAAASEAVETNTNEVYLAESRRKRQTSRIRKLAAATALYATISSGGVVDNVMGHLHNPRETVMSDLKEASQLPESIDGTPFNALAPADQASYKHDVLLSQQATERVAQTMADLGHHNYGAIQDRAKAFIEAHVHEIMPIDERDAFLKQLNEAPNKDASLKVLQEFMGYYGMTAGFNDTDTDGGEIGAYNHDSTPNSDTQQAIRGIIEAFSYLPKSFIADGGFRTVLIGNSISDALALYSGNGEGDSQGIMYIATHSATGNIGFAALNMVPSWLQDHYTAEGSIIHELGHAKASTIEGNAPPISLRKVFEQAATDIIDMPHDVSQYATDDSDEQTAEDFRVAIDIQAGPAAPNETRRFDSNANKQVLEVLQQYEQQMPGLTDYLISMNARLMGQLPRH